jgi:hypothetical protein
MPRLVGSALVPPLSFSASPWNLLQSVEATKSMEFLFPSWPLEPKVFSTPSHEKKEFLDAEARRGVGSGWIDYKQATLLTGLSPVLIHLVNNEVKISHCHPLSIKRERKLLHMWRPSLLPCQNIFARLGKNLHPFFFYEKNLHPLIDQSSVPTVVNENAFS